MKRDRIFDIQKEPRRQTEKIIVDLFAGGGGMSEGIKLALNRHPDFALNHNADALSMHAANHPQTRHLIADVRELNPYDIVRHPNGSTNKSVGYLHLSPDCRDFSQAKGGQPRDRKIRALSWVAIYWAGTVRPDVISLENVAQILRWGPMVAKRDPKTGRVVKVDGTVAAKGEYVPLRDQFLVPDPKRLGETWKRFVAILRSMGYVVEWRVDRACNQGVATFRERLMMYARCDGEPLVWPEATHAKQPAEDKLPFKPAADAIDFSIPGKSIFGRKKPLADASQRRLAIGIGRHVLKEANPFIISLTHQGSDRIHPITNPLPTVTGANRGEFAFVAPVLVQTGYGERKGQAPRVLDLKQPLGTVVAGGSKHALGVAYLAQMNGGFNDVRGVPGRDLREPMSSITQKGSQQQLVTAHLVHLRGNCDARSVEEPLHTISAGGQHHGLVECVLSQDDFEGAKRVAAFLRHYGVIPEGDADDISGVLLNIGGIEYAIVDVLLRMLVPRELFNAQGFPHDYIIERGHDGRPFSLTKQIHMCGNSVPPLWAAAYVRANLPHLAVPPDHPKATGRERTIGRTNLSGDRLAA
ncbi:DNA cytosine methyltransferase [Paraburkholderia fungorum]|uniref:DNA cytosine methyltransferase n=2 Tax=Paraburkholderia fungorum TaxID=134537 RepID=UPI00161BED08|nr:DNA cytosine methyltransferase [Paraburkholderia fungorum]MBB5546552.1 DNA (cytosine-5)-methyltransferase 1 [Paraburkholderia fungorum]